MAKRFTDTEKWKKPFLRGLQGAYKLLWLYICDDCDHAGVWQVDMEIAQIKIGENITEEQALKAFGNKIKVFDNGSKWFIPSFIEFQYPSGLHSANKAHSSVLNILKNKGLPCPLDGAMDMDMDMDMDKRVKKRFVKPTIEEVRKYFKENGYSEFVGEQAFNGYDVANWHDSKGNKILNWKQKMIQVWFKDKNKIITKGDTSFV